MKNKYPNTHRGFTIRDDPFSREMMSWINKALVYEKLKDIKNCNYCCEKAISMGHFGTYPYKRLIVNYVKAKDWDNALRVCDKVFENEKAFDHKKFFTDKNSTWEEISFYTLNRKEFILSKLGYKEYKLKNS
jgi:hypothetical protein